MKTTSEITLTDKNPQTELEGEIYALTEIEGYIRSAFKKMAGTNIRDAMFFVNL